jgi:hypothetical protein
VGNWRGGSQRAELEGENKRGGGMEVLLYCTGGFGGGGEQCGKVTLSHCTPPPHTLPPWQEGVKEM